MAAKRKRNAQNNKKSAITGQKCVISSDIATQTTPKVYKNRELCVVLKRLSQQKIFGQVDELQDDVSGKTFNNQTSGEEEKDVSSEQSPSMITIVKRPDVLSRIPSNYQRFVQPITNNKNASSTIASSCLDKEQHYKPIMMCKRPITRKSTYSNYIKPGPKCSKPPCYFLQDNRIPVMLDDSHIREKSPNHTLLPAIEEINESTLCTPLQEEKVIAVENSISSVLNSVAEITNDEVSVVVQMEQEKAISVPIQDTPHSNSNEDGTTADEEKERTRLENVRFSYENYTTLVRARGENHSESDTTDSTNNESRPKKQRKKRRKKYIVIEASTVHIHNHFYNRQ